MLENSISLRTLDKEGRVVSGVLYEIIGDQDNIIASGQLGNDDARPIRIRFTSDMNTIQIKASFENWSDLKSIDINQTSYDFHINRIIDGKDYEKKSMNHKNWLNVAAFIIGVIFLVAIFIISELYPNPTVSQWQVRQVLLSFMMAAFAGGILGLIDVNLNFSNSGLIIQASGALAVGIIVYFFAPSFAIL